LLTLSVSSYSVHLIPGSRRVGGVSYEDVEWTGTKLVAEGRVDCRQRLRQHFIFAESSGVSTLSGGRFHGPDIAYVQLRFTSKTLSKVLPKLWLVCLVD